MSTIEELVMKQLRLEYEKDWRYENANHDDVFLRNILNQLSNVELLGYISLAIEQKGEV